LESKQAPRINKIVAFTYGQELMYQSEFGNHCGIGSQNWVGNDGQTRDPK
jgi:hypothetical protein